MNHALDGGEDCRGRLLIIDDDPIQSAIVGRIATAAGYETLVVGSIEEASGDLHVVSPGSPLGTALMGSKAGDSVTYDAPHGPLTVVVVEIE